MRFIARLCAPACIVAFPVFLVAQSPAPARFDEVSIVARTGNAPVGGGVSSPARFERPDTTLMELVLYAYDLRPLQIVGDPDWMSTKRWQVSAKASAPVQRDAMRQLVRRMLVDRLALKAHIERRLMPIYNLALMRAGTLGPKIKPATVDCMPFLTGERPMQESPRDPNHRFGLCAVGGSFTPSGLLTPRLNGQPVTGLLQHLEETLERPVIDRTGLKGTYDIELSYLDESLADPSVSSNAQSPSKGPSLFSALQEQLGMKLESARGLVDVLVIDSASEPTTD
jgi:uncharacterized protein (TIGR03435 family)